MKKIDMKDYKETKVEVPDIDFDCKVSFREIIDDNEKLTAENRRLREALGGLLFHCQDYNLSEGSFVLAMEIERARQVLKELDNEKKRSY